MNARKQTKQTKKLNRGQRFNRARTDAASPIQVTAISMWEPEESQKRDGVPVARGRKRPRYGCKIILRLENSIRANQSLDLKEQRIERGEIDGSESAQKDPPRNKAPGRAFEGVKQPAN